MGFGAALKPANATKADTLNIFAEALEKIIEERQIILRDEKLNSKEKARLLESTRAMLFTVRGDRLVKTDKIVYAILVFGAVVMITLSLLTCFAGLPKEVTLTFVGTVVGGTIATIAQKLGRL